MCVQYTWRSTYFWVSACACVFISDLGRRHKRSMFIKVAETWLLLLTRLTYGVAFESAHPELSKYSSWRYYHYGPLIVHPVILQIFLSKTDIISCKICHTVMHIFCLSHIQIHPEDGNHSKDLPGFPFPPFSPRLTLETASHPVILSTLATSPSLCCHHHDNHHHGLWKKCPKVPVWQRGCN